MSQVTKPARNGLARVKLVLTIVVFSVGSLLALSQVDGRSTYRGAAKSQVEMLAGAVDMYVLAIGSCPTTRQGLDALISAPTDLTEKEKWKGPYLDHLEIPVDPWSNPYHYKATSNTEFRIWSNGPDGIACTKDDIVSVP